MNIVYTVYDWCGQCSKEIEQVGLSTHAEFEGDPFEMAKKLYELNVNTMIYKVKQGEDKGKSILYVDNRRFQQR
jgi:hypothetical protein